jgi:hypothetical protein
MRNHDVTTFILESLRISDVVSISRTCRSMRVLGREVVQRRLTRLLEPFGTNNTLRFISTLKEGKGVITGSIVRAMLANEDDYVRRDLNIVIPWHAFGTLHEAVVDMLGFTPISSVPHGAIAPRIGRFCIFARNQQFITLSASHEGESVLHIILNAPTTADMVFMTTGGACYFYPQWFEGKLAIQSHTASLVPRNKKLGCVGELTDEFVVETDTGFLGKSCGNLCPTYWHHVKQKDLRVAIDWNLDDSVTNVYHNVDVEWRLNTECHNQKCPHNVNVMGMNIEGVGARNREYACKVGKGENKD